MASPLLFFEALILLPSAALCSVPSAANSSAAPTVLVTLAVVLPERNVRYLGAWPRVAPALSLALEALQPELRQAGLAVRTVFASSEEKGSCSRELAEQNAARLKVSQDPDVLLGLGCDSPEDRLRDWASRWGLPLLSAGDYEGLSDFTTTVYAGPATSEPQGFLELLSHHFGWSRPAVFAFSRQAHDFHQYFSGLSRESNDFTPRGGLDDRPDEALQFIRSHGRVVYIHGSPETLQQMMRLAQAQNMTNGDYAFIYLDILGESLEAAGHREAAKPWQSKKGQDSGILREAFQTVLIITSHKPQTLKYRRFQSQLILRAQRDFGVALNDSMHKNLVAGCFHDVLLLYLRALNETLHEGGTKRDTSRILEKMRHLEIQGVTGRVTIGFLNRRNTVFDLWSMADTESGQYQVVGRHRGSTGRVKWLGPIHWKKGSPPLDDPPCVFNMDDPSCDKGFWRASAETRHPYYSPIADIVKMPFSLAEDLHPSKKERSSNCTVVRTAVVC